MRTDIDTVVQPIIKQIADRTNSSEDFVVNYLLGFAVGYYRGHNNCSVEEFIEQSVNYINNQFSQCLL